VGLFFSQVVVTAITSSVHLTLDPSAQIQQFWRGISTLAESVWESTDAAFRRVHLVKKDANGNIKLYDKKEQVVDLVTGETKEVTKKEALLTYIEDVKSGEFYRDEPSYIVASKCALITFVMPIYTVGAMGWQGAKTLFKVCAVALEVITSVGEQLSLGNGSEAGKRCGYGSVQLLQELGTGLFEVVKAPLFGLGCELAAIYGIFKPYHGRKCEALIENAWQQGASYREDLREIPARPNETCWTAAEKDMRTARAFYLAHCFQPRGNVREPHITVIRREMVK
jgi:hypothetical protein